jgi:uncharacterized membrane protein YgaE (UPF0421/DUF939 family)
MKRKKNHFENKTAMVWKMAIGSAFSWELAKLVGSDHPYLAPLSVVLCLQTTIDQSIRYSFHRILGTIIGIILTAFLVSHLDMNGWILGLIMLGATFIAKWLRLDETVLHQVALTIVLIFTFERKSKDYALDRIVDTIIGAVIAVLIHMFLFPPDFTKKAATSFEKLTRQLSEILLELSHWIELEWGSEKAKVMEDKINLFSQELHNTKDALNMASKSLKFNPFSKKHKSILSMYQMEIKKMNKGYQYVSTIVGTLKEWEKEGQPSSYDQMEVGNHLKTLSEFFENLEVLHQNELKKEKETDLQGLLDLLPSKMLLNSQPSYKLYRDSFYLETKKLLKSLF